MGIEHKYMQGTVVSDKMDKTVVVLVGKPKRHPLYKKTIKLTKRYKAHDEKNECKVGDVVKIVEARPMSKEKRWYVSDIIERAEVVEVKPSEI